MGKILSIAFALGLGFTAYGFSWWVTFLSVSAGYTCYKFIMWLDENVEEIFYNGLFEDSE